MSRLGVFLAAYVGLTLLAVVLSLAWLGEIPWQHQAPWFALSTPAAHLTSLAGGLVLGALVVVGTRFAVEHSAWARRLHADLRPFVQDITPWGIVALAVLSGLGEELLFRGVLLSKFGLVPQAIVFGLAHQIPGASRWVWAFWAALMGLLLGVLFEATGSLAGPILSHAFVNGVNLYYLKSFDPGEQPRVMAGLLRRVDERRR